MVYANEADLLNVAFFGVFGYLNPLKLWYIIVGGTIYLGEMKVGYPTCLPISVTKGEWRFRARWWRKARRAQGGPHFRHPVSNFLIMGRSPFLYF
jgi:hypothetical protein